MPVVPLLQVERRAMQVLEKTVDQGIVRWARSQWPEMIIRKLSTFGSMGTNGDPDRLFFYKNKLILIEMKRPGGMCTDLQLQRHNEWRRAGAKVMVVDSVVAGKEILNREYGTKRKTIKTWRTSLIHS